MKNKRIRDRKHLAFIRELFCCVCLAPEPQAAHIRVGNSGGTGLKPGDDCTIPMCAKCHAKQHSFGEYFYWRSALTNAQQLAEYLYEITGDIEAARVAVAGFANAWKKL